MGNRATLSRLMVVASLLLAGLTGTTSMGQDQTTSAQTLAEALPATHGEWRKSAEVAVYDGSWSEWGRLEGAPIETGPSEREKIL